MKAFLFHTGSHRSLLEEFLIPSLPEDLELHLHHGAQTCPSANYMSAGWLQCMRDKVKMMIDAIESNDGSCILHLDADIQFFTPRIESLLIQHLDDCELVAQSDGLGEKSNELCGGLFAVRCCEATRRLFDFVMELMNERNIHDQEALNEAVRRLGLRWRVLPPGQFWSPRAPWRSGMPLEIPSTAIAHHANWCVGVDQKRRQLAFGRELMAARVPSPPLPSQMLEQKGGISPV